MILSAFLKLDSAAFTTRIGTAIEGVKSLISISGDLAGRFAVAFDAGGHLNHLSMQLGESAGQLRVLRQAFADTGVGAEALGSTLALMRKSLGGVNDQGEPTGAMFKKLGLDIEALKGMGAEQQMDVIGTAIRGLGTAADQSAAAMGIFGRSGSAMLSFFKSGDAIGNARASLGGLPALLDRNAAAFDNISTNIGRIREKGQGLWAGLAEGILPLADQVSTVLDGLDLTKWGQDIGTFIGTVAEMFKMAGWGKIVSLTWAVAWREAINYSVTALTEMGNLIFRLLSTPIAAIGTYYNQMIELVMLGLSKIPKVNKMLGLEGFEMTPVADAFENIRGDIMDTFAFKGEKMTLFDAADQKAELAEIFNQALPVYQQKIKEVQDAANAAAVQLGGASLGDNAVVKGVKGVGGGSAVTDALQRIGGSIGGSAPTGRMEGLARDTLGVSRSMLQKLTKIADAPPGAGRAMVWG